jgi:hypothetical protein
MVQVRLVHREVGGFEDYPHPWGFIPAEQVDAIWMGGLVAFEPLTDELEQFVRDTRNNNPGASERIDSGELVLVRLLDTRAEWLAAR